MVSSPTLAPRSMKPVLPSGPDVPENVEDWALAPSTENRTRAPGKSWPNWSNTSATSSCSPPTIFALCFGVRVIDVGTGTDQVTVTELESWPLAVAVMVEVPVTSERKEKRAPPPEVGALPVVLPAPVTVKLTFVPSPTRFPSESLTWARTVSVPWTGASPPGRCWISTRELAGPAQLAVALPEAGPAEAVTVILPRVPEVNEKEAFPDPSEV